MARDLEERQGDSYLHPPTSMMHRSNIQICPEVLQTKLRRLRSEYGSIDSWRPCHAHAHCHKMLVRNFINSNMNSSGSTTCKQWTLLSPEHLQRLPNYSWCQPLLPKGCIKQRSEDGLSTCFKQRLLHFFSRMRRCRVILHWTQHLITPQNSNHPSLATCVFSLLLCHRWYWPLRGRCGSVHVHLGDILHIHLRRRKHVLGIKCVGHSLHGLAIAQTFATSWCTRVHFSANPNCWR